MYGGTTWTGNVIQRYGGLAGDMAQNAFLKFIGNGDYTIVGNSLMNGSKDPSGRPSVQSNGRAIRVRYREYLGEIQTHPTIVGAFNSRSYNVNPGDMITFPWLSSIAIQFDQYHPNGVVFEFKSTATEFSTGASLGSVMAATEYDVNDPPYSSKMEMLNSAYGSEAKMANDLLHGIECDPVELGRSVFYTTQNGATLAGKDQMDYNVCTTTIATSGGSLPINSSVGSLYVSYDFTFYKEQITQGIFSRSTVHQVNRGALVAGVPLWTTLLVPQFAGRNNIITSLSTAGGFCNISINKIYANGTFRIRIQMAQPTANFWTTTATALTTPPTVTGGALIFTAGEQGLFFNNETSNYCTIFPAPAQSTSQASHSFFVKLGPDLGTDCLIQFTSVVANYAITSAASLVATNQVQVEVDLVPADFWSAN